MQLNDLVTRGSIIYTDSNGVFDSMLCQPYGMLRVEFQHYNTEFDGEITASFESEDLGIDSDFSIENISILERHVLISDGAHGGDHLTRLHRLQETHDIDRNISL